MIVFWAPCERIACNLEDGAFSRALRVGLTRTIPRSVDHFLLSSAFAAATT